MSDEDNTTTKIVDKSNDRKYFAVVPRIVMALCSNTYEYTLWGAVKDITGEEGTCILGIRELAILSMMSPAKAHESLHSLIKKGLLEGAVSKDPDYHKPVWHLTIPDLWARNIAYATNNLSLLKRVAAKEVQRYQVINERSPHERSSERSPGDGERSPGECERSPGSTKEEEELKELKEEGKGVSQNTWVSLLAELKERMRKHELGTYREYFEPTWLLAIDDHTFTVAVLDERRRAWLADRGTDIIERALAGFTGEKTSVEFVVREETV
jgi:hypothetical protein